MDKREAIKRALNAEGIKMHLRGYAYLITALGVYTPGMALVKGVYADVAKAHQTTASRAERAIRHAIEGRGLEEKNSEFLSRVYYTYLDKEEAK